MTKLLIPLLFITCLSVFAAQEGIASWYGGKFQGRTTANGEIFDTNKFTAAHKTLPFGTMVKVTNLENGSTTVVRINDRGPFIPGRIIDLSRAAAMAIGMTGRGIARVRIEELESNLPEQYYFIQFGAFSSQVNAEKLKSRLLASGLNVVVEKTSGGINRVLLRGISASKLEGVKDELEKCGISNYLVRREIEQE
jgi:rare lipoprotein A